MAYLSHPVSEPATPLVGYAGDLKSGVVSRESWLGAQCQRVGPEELIHGSRMRLESQRSQSQAVSLQTLPVEARFREAGGRGQRRIWLVQHSDLGLAPVSCLGNQGSGWTTSLPCSRPAYLYVPQTDGL